MTASMVTKARNNAKKAGIEGVEFRLPIPGLRLMRSCADPFLLMGEERTE